MKLPSGLIRKTFSLSASAAALILCTAALSSAAKIPTPEPDAVTLLPKSLAVQDWEVYPDTLVYACGGDLTEIYNGGYELYTDNGVIDAAQQMYRRTDDIAIVTVHRLTSIRDARLFFEYWKNPDKKQATFGPIRALMDAYVYTADGTANGNLYRHRYFVTASVYIDGEDGRKASEEFLRSVSIEIGKLVRQRK